MTNYETVWKIFKVAIMQKENWSTEDLMNLMILCRSVEQSTDIFDNVYELATNPPQGKDTRAK